MEATYNIIPQNQAIQPYSGNRQVYYRPRMPQQQGGMICYPMQQGMYGLKDELTDEEVNKIIGDYIQTVPKDVLLQAGGELLSGRFETAKIQIIKPLMEKLCTAGIIAKTKGWQTYVLYGLITLAVIYLGYRIYKNNK